MAADPAATRTGGTGGWTGALRRLVERDLPADSLMPVEQPTYVNSWVYVFGVVTVAALVWVILTGVVLSFFGPQWWHLSGVGRFFNSMHFWSVQIFFAAMVLHLWTQYFGAGWRDGRAGTWVVGAVIFAISIVAAFTGYLSQQNFDAQWIAVNAKDAINSSGAGAFFNVLNFGQMYGIHVMLVPTVVLALIGLHLVQVRMRGVVKPIAKEEAR